MDVALLRPWFAGRRVLVVGLGISGGAAARLLARLGAGVSVTERRPLSAVGSERRELPKGVPLETGGHRLLREDWDLVVASPGVPAALLDPLRRRGVPVWGEMELGHRVLSLLGRWPRRTAAVTGTNGKTTTTALLGAMFRAAGFQTVVAGNIGSPLCDRIDSIDRETALALEVSSYQLETVESFRVSAGTVLNLSPDHLARHGTMEGYARTKFRLFQTLAAGGTALVNAADPWCHRLAREIPGGAAWFGLSGERRPGVFLRGRKMVSTLPGGMGSWDPPALLAGSHNVENALAAVGLARALGTPARAVAEALRSFPGVEHRLEFVREVRGVRYVNDSKGTNVDSTLTALKSFPEGRVRIIMGGQDKGAPYLPLRPLVKSRVRTIYLIGEAAEKIRRELAGGAPMVESGTLKNAVGRAAAEAEPGDVVLLSPACASFDQFKNYEHRGRAFKDLVGAL